MTDKEFQEDELLALASIYDSEVFSTTLDEDGITTVGGQFVAHLDLPESFHIIIQNAQDKKKHAGQANNENPEHQEFTVKYLPPITLFFEFPSDYPSKRPPQITVSCKWLTLEQISRLCRRLDEIWEENEKGDVVLFTWTSFLKDDSLKYLEIQSPLDLTKVVDRHTKQTHPGSESASGTANGETEAQSLADDVTGACGGCVDVHSTIDPRAVQDIASQSLLLPAILEHDTVQREKDFLSTFFTCQVCFMEKLGALCMSFPTCDHVFCKDCMRGYFEVQIGDGNVKALTCPNSDCETEALPSQVKDLVSAELFQRYDRLLLQTSLDTMTDITYCPRRLCGCAVMVDDGMGNCPACHYIFCTYCKHTYHGISPCKIKCDEVMKIRDEYTKATPARKAEMEKRYGRRAMQQIIEESYSNEYLQREARKCPHCSTWIQKIDGCNKMTCTKCRTFFCWLCQAQLPKLNPYSHFNVPASDCFNQLFQGVQNEEDEDFLPDDYMYGDSSDDEDDALFFRVL